MILRRWRFWASLAGIAIPYSYLIFGEIFGLGVRWEAASAAWGLAAGVLALGYLGWRVLAWPEARFRHKGLPASGLEGVVLASLVISLLSLWFSPDPRMGMEQALMSVGYVVLFFFLVDAAEAGASLTGAVYGMLGVTGMVTVLAVLETYFWYLSFWQQAGTLFALPAFPYRLVSVLGHPNFYMAFANLPAPLALVIFLKTSRRSVRFLAGLWLAFYLVSVPFSSSRGGWLGMAAWMGTLAFYWAAENARWRKGLAWLKRYKVLAAVAGAGLILVGLPVLWKAYLAVALHPSHSSDPFGGRFVLWGAALQIWQRHPWIGVGVGRYLYEYLNVNPSFPPGFWSFHAHNLYLTTLAEQGIAGFLAFMAMVVWGVVCMVRWQRGSPPSLKPWTAAMLAGIAGWLVHSIFDDFTTVAPVMVQVALLAAFLRAGMWPRPQALKRVPLAALLVVAAPALVLTVWIGWAAAPLRAGIERVAQASDADAVGRANAWGEAAALAAESARRDPAYVYYQEQAGLAWAKAWGWSGAPEDLAQARHYFTRALELEPSLSLVWANAAVLDWQAGEREQAVERMLVAVERSPYEPGYALNLGWFYEQQGQEEQADRWYARALELAPALSTHVFWQGSSVRISAAAQGSSAFRQYLAETPPSWKIAQDALQSGYLDEARSAVAVAQAAGEDELAVLVVQAALADAENRPEEARRAYQGILQILRGDYMGNRSYIANMYARFHKRSGFDVEAAPGYLLLKPDYGQVQALHTLYQQQVSAGDCAAAGQTWLAVRKSMMAGEGREVPYPDCGAPLPYGILIP